MDDFREWLSDNLRYIMLGVGIILILLLIFFGIRFISGFVVSPDADQIGTEADTEQTSETPTPTPEAAPVVSDKLELNAVPEVFTLIGTYYNAIAAKDVATIRTLVDNLTPEDENVIKNNSVEAYSNINVYTKAHENGSYVTFVSYKYKLANIATLVPGLSQLYVCPDEDDSFYICTAAPDAETQAFIDEAVKSSEVQALVSQIQADYDAALAGDATLNAYFNPENGSTAEPSQEASAEGQTEVTPEPESTVTPEPESTVTPEPESTVTPEPESSEATEPESEPEYETVVLKKSANFRDAPSNDSNIIEGIKKGTEMLKLGEKGGWFHVRINGVDGYIAARFF